MSIDLTGTTEKSRIFVGLTSLLTRRTYRHTHRHKVHMQDDWLRSSTCVRKGCNTRQLCDGNAGGTTCFLCLFVVCVYICTLL